MPAAVSTISTSRLVVSWLNAWTRPRCSAVDSSAMRAMPEAAGITRKPWGAVTIASSSVQRPSSTCSSVKRGVRPSSTSTFARLRSPSSNSTRLPRAACAAARLTATDVLPTPPLPPVTAITCTGSGRTTARMSAAWAGSKLCDAMSDSSETPRQEILTGCGARDAGQLYGAAHQLVGARGIEVFWNALAVADVAHGDLVSHQCRDGAAEAAGLVELREHAAHR